MEYHPGDQSTAENYLFMLNAIVPRPVAWVSTVGQEGLFNLAPFSFYNGVCAEPFLLSVSIARRAGEKKDTLRNIENSGEFVVSVVAESMAAAMNESSASFPPDVSEFEQVGLTPIPARFVQAPLVRESPINMECRLFRLIEIGTPPQGTTLVLGEIIHYHIDDRILTNGKIDFKKFIPIGRLGKEWNAGLKNLFSLKRPR
jgi:flavin reductase (DIM6/NTAB) family NADH-FMN oxidoreductase RutF